MPNRLNITTCPCMQNPQTVVQEGNINEKENYKMVYLCLLIIYNLLYRKVAKLLRVGKKNHLQKHRIFVKSFYQLSSTLFSTKTKLTKEIRCRLFELSNDKLVWSGVRRRFCLQH